VTVSAFQMDIDIGSRHESMHAFYQGAACRRVDDADSFAGSDARADNPVLGQRLAAAGLPSIAGHGRHNGRH
jgi:hypothetical protein